jgi:hypothetical protein
MPVTLSRGVRAVALVPGTGEYALATTPVYLSDRPGARWPANLNSPSGETDLVTSLAQLTERASMRLRMLPTLHYQP